MEGVAKRYCLAISLIFFLLLVPTVHGAINSTEGAGGETVAAVRTAAAGGGHGHGYTSHRSHNPNNPENGGSGTPVVDPHNVAARGHHHRGAASRTAAGGDPLLATWMLLGATLFLWVLG
ncbi:uncharacterized protein LOC121055019 [Oryza brachyantha]|uniref:uncharacterized protein LOC121055019 n=1 Tax=Oryza brachyantha TaxID=4533 RepID=UPI001ADCB15B|nr:uncharacterized protein LOC121055019 [Oryza brachyantha]